MNKQLDNLYSKLSYKFNDADLIDSALTHRSARGVDNERLEFLGDSIVNMIIAEALYHKFPNAKEGQLSRLRSNLVRGDTLANIALEFELGEFLHLGPGELKSGGKRRKSILADAMEAVIGALFLDGGFDACREKITAWYQSRLDTITLEQNQKDPKTRLQEFLQANKYQLPAYKIMAIEGEAHKQLFHIACTVKGLDFKASGQGTSRRKAEQLAATAYLKLLQVEEVDE